MIAYKMNKYLIKSIRKLYRIISGEKHNWRNDSKAMIFDQEANDYVREALFSSKDGLMVCKFGTIELDAICCCIRRKRGLNYNDYIDYIKGKGNLFPEDCLHGLINNAGFFPCSVEKELKYADLTIQDLRDIDIIGSYIDQEEYIDSELQHCVRINLDGYLAPFMWENPWTKFLKGKNVLVIHPFAESILKQYDIREKLFENPDVLPEFKSLRVIKAVQSIAGNGINTGFSDWFEALQYMEDEIDKVDFDVALIGCGAYGMNLAAYIKRKGKTAIHMAGWVQMLFGIYGNRWIEDQPEFKKYINEYWIRPSEKEKPKGIEKVENGCYW